MSWHFLLSEFENQKPINGICPNIEIKWIWKNKKYGIIFTNVYHLQWYLW